MFLEYPICNEILVQLSTYLKPLPNRKLSKLLSHQIFNEILINSNLNLNK